MKEEIIDYLAKHNGQYASGELVSRALGISRAAVSKHIKALKAQGYEIESAPHKGHRLLKRPDILSYSEIAPYLTTKTIARNLIHLYTTPSTNRYAKALAASNAPHGSAIISEEQTAGKGRLGSYWPSDKGVGIWLSLLLRPETHPRDAEAFTQFAAQSVCDALALWHIDAEIHGTGDICINGCKIAGILTEMDAELDLIHHLIIGVGIHVSGKTGYEPEVCSISSTTNCLIDRNQLTAEFFNAFERHCTQRL